VPIFYEDRVRMPGEIRVRIRLRAKVRQSLLRAQHFREDAPARRSDRLPYPLPCDYDSTQQLEVNLELAQPAHRPEY